MNKPPSLPELPPMQAAKTPPPPAADARHQQPPLTGHPVGGTRRMRQMMTVLTGGGFAVIGVVLFFQLVARPGLRPTDLMATIEAQTELGVMNQKLGAQPGVIKITEAEYQERMAKAQRDGQAAAELDYQKKLAVVEADKTLLIGAYEALYQRTNKIVEAALQLENLAQQFRARLLEMTNGGRSVVIGFKDLLCGLGDPDSCASAHEDRRSMIAEADELSRGDVGARVRELMADVDDPATLIAKTHQPESQAPAAPQS